MVAMVPSFMSTLITSAAFTDMRCASSPTAMVSGTAISRVTGSAGWLKVCCSAATPPRCRAPPLACQPATPPPMSPRVLMVRRRTESSRMVVVGFAFFGLLSGLASPVLGACSVPSTAGAAPGWACAFSIATCASRSAARCSASRCSRSCLSRSSAACSAESCSWRRASSSRSSRSRSSSVGAAGPAGAGATGAGGGACAADSCAASSAGSRFTNTRFLRTST